MPRWAWIAAIVMRRTDAARANHDQQFFPLVAGHRAARGKGTGHASHDAPGSVRLFTWGGHH